jgi:glycosyltransferase involved in cell wall biosynthesis
MEKTKITLAFFLPSLEAGGAERNVVNIVNNLNRKKYDISLVLAEAKGDFLSEIAKDVPITNLNVLGNLKLFFRLINYFRNQKIGIFISAFPRINIICLIAKIFSGKNIKIVITEHSVFSLLPVIAKTAGRRFFARFFLPSLVKIIYPKADAVICVSSGIADDFLKIIYFPEKIKVIYNPIINDKIYKLAEEDIIHPWFSDLKIPVIVSAGRLVKCKDYPNLLEALNLVLQKQPVRLAILGAGPEKEKLVKLAEKLGLSQNIAFLGFQKNPYKFMKKASIFVLSSLQEGFGNVIIEAMAFGTPVVSTNCPAGPGEIIENMKNGILTPVGDKKALAAAILKILNNPGLTQKFSIEGKKRAQLFSVEESVRGYEKLFDELTNKK